MLWIIGACALAVVAGVELRRSVRERAEDAGPRRYALYAPNQPDRAILLVEVAADLETAVLTAQESGEPASSIQEVEGAPRKGGSDPTVPPPASEHGASV
jgi:hypothetical protein